MLEWLDYLDYAILAALVVVLIFLATRFRPARTAKIADDLYAVNCLFVNFYAVTAGGEVALFDAGLNAAMARRGLEKLGLSPSQVTHVFLTHSDYDHAGGLAAFPNAEVYMAQAEAQMVNGQTTRRGPMRNHLSRAYKTLADGETITFGGTDVKLMLTPGHTPGSASYLVGGRALITGDLLRVTRNGDVKPFLRLMNKNHAQDIKAVDAMRETAHGAGYICTGHTGWHKN